MFDLKIWLPMASLETRHSSMAPVSYRYFIHFTRPWRNSLTPNELANSKTQLHSVRLWFQSKIRKKKVCNLFGWYTNESGTTPIGFKSSTFFFQKLKIRYCLWKGDFYWWSPYHVTQPCLTRVIRRLLLLAALADRLFREYTRGLLGQHAQINTSAEIVL